MLATNWVDYTIIGVIALSTFISLFRGLVREVLSLMTWIIAFIFAFKFFARFADYLSPYIHHDSLRRAISFAIIFGVVLILGSFINHILSQLVLKTGLRGPDRIFGMVFGFGRGVLLVAIMLLLLLLNGAEKDDWWTSSTLVPKILPVVNWLHDLLPEKFKDFDAKSLTTNISIELPNKK